MTDPVGTLCIVLHTHLPWLWRHGTWPVGEEWLHQAWAQSYLPLVEVLTGLAEDGRRDVLTLGVTPVLAAQLDAPECLTAQHQWLGTWRLRAEELAVRADAEAAVLRDVAAAEFSDASRALDVFERRWRHGGSAALRALVDSGTVEILGGPATHPVLPLLPEPVARLALRAGLDDAAVRLGGRPPGVWTPECAVSPEVAGVLAAEGVSHTLVDEATLRAAGGGTDDVWLDGELAVVGRDLELTDRVWSARSGYPAGAAYRDFHRYDVGSGIRVFRVTDPSSGHKQPYDAAAAAAAARRDAADFVTATAQRLADRRAAGEQPLAVVAWDTELFGHWWHEGPQFLDNVLRLLPAAGVRTASLRTVVGERRDPRRRVRLPVGSWGAGKDLHLWSGPAVADLARDAKDVSARLLDLADHESPDHRGRRPWLDATAREALLALSSDWAFMVSRDSAADYARRRHREHVERFHALADGDVVAQPGPGVVPHLDARPLTTTATALPAR